MFEVIYRWNVARPDLAAEEFASKIELRGYRLENTGLTGEFANNLALDKIRPLSVGEIATNICPSKRDLYFSKGLNRVTIADKKTWGRKAGKFVENYFYHVLPYNKQILRGKYSFLRNKIDSYSAKYFYENQKSIGELEELELKSDKQTGDTLKLVNMLTQAGRAEFILKGLNDKLKRFYDITTSRILIEKQLNPETNRLGINAPTTPDFIIPHAGIIGDIKTGTNFKMDYTLTCAGYALAYENEYKQPINWGSIFFVPTHTSSKYYKATTYPQVYFFPIDDILRQWFLEERDNAYNIISQTSVPNFPTKKNQCNFCKYKAKCLQDGLVIE